MRLLTELSERSERGDGLRVRVLENSGLCGGMRRDLNLLREIVETAAAKLRADNLEDTLSSVLRMEKWRKTGKKRADGVHGNRAAVDDRGPRAGTHREEQRHPAAGTALR